MTAAAAPISLSGDALCRAFPFHLVVDAQLKIRQIGQALKTALPGLRNGDWLGEHLECMRPRTGSAMTGWLAHGQRLCTLRTLAEPQLSLRGNAEWLEDGSMLLLLTPVLHSMESMTALGLRMSDFAKHDGVADTLIMSRSTQMSARDAEHLAAKLRIRSAQLDLIVDMSANGIAFVTADGKLQRVNAALLAMLGLENGNLSCQSLQQLQAHVRSLMTADCRGAADIFSLHGRDDPPPRLLHLNAPRLAVLRVTTRGTLDGERAFYIDDITRETEVDRMKSEFLSTAAHELRTPMVSIFGFTELLLHRPVAEERRRDMLETIHRQSARLIHMVNELLDLARIEARQGSDMLRRPYRLGQLTHETVAALMVQGDARKVEVSIDHDAAMLLIDVGKTSQALTNVLSNAFKYSPQGGPIRLSTLSGSLDGSPDGDPAIGIRVTDEGLGMTPEQLARTCERFYRADPSGTIPGTGLGLSLVKEIIELQGGRVEIHSEYERGTHVTLWLPLAAPLHGPGRSAPQA